MSATKSRVYMRTLMLVQLHVHLDEPALPLLPLPFDLVFAEH